MLLRRCVTLACWAMAIGCIAGQRAEATVIAADNFDYPDGTLADNGAATGGWAGPWRTGCCDPFHDVADGQLTAAGIPGEDSRMHHDLAAALGEDDTSVYIGLDYEFGVFYNGFEAHNEGDGDEQRVLQLAFEDPTQRLIVGTDEIDFTDQTGMHRYVIGLTFGTEGSDSVELFIDGLSAGSTPLSSEFVADRVGFGSFLGPGPSAADTLVIATTFEEANLGDAVLSCDFDGDGHCDSGDFATLRDNMFTEGTLVDGDANGNGFIDFADYRLFKDHPQRVVGNQGGLGAGAAQIPEPATVLMVGLAGLLGSMARRRPRRCGSRGPGSRI